MKEKARTYKQYVDSGTGRTVTKEYAEANPKTTQSRTVWVKPRAKPEDVVLDDAPIGELNQGEVT